MTVNTPRTTNLVSRQRTAAVILAGGRGTRMGGVNKAALEIAGERFVDRCLRQLPYGTPAVVVSPYFLGVPQVCESPLFGGPAAGIARGVEELRRREVSAHQVAIFAVDAPDSPRLLPQLEEALGTTDVAIARGPGGRLEPLCALWRAKALRGAIDKLSARRGSLTNAAAFQLIRQTEKIAVVPGNGTERDYDTPAELRAFQTRG